MRSNPIRGVILDMDGTLVDSNDGHAKTWAEALNEFGYPVTVESVRPLIGIGSDKLLPRLTGEIRETGLGERISERRSQLFEQHYMAHIAAFPCSKMLVERMHKAGLKVVIASSSKREHLDRLIDTVGIGNLIDAVTSASDVDDSKPDPDVVQAALDKLGIAPDNTVMIGDTPYDIEAAARVGVRTIALRCGGWDDDALTGAIAIYNDPGDLLDHFSDVFPG